MPVLPVFAVRPKSGAEELVRRQTETELTQHTDANPLNPAPVVCNTQNGFLTVALFMLQKLLKYCRSQTGQHTHGSWSPLNANVLFGNVGMLVVGMHTWALQPSLAHPQCAVLCQQQPPQHPLHSPVPVINNQTYHCYDSNVMHRMSQKSFINNLQGRVQLPCAAGILRYNNCNHNIEQQH